MAVSSAGPAGATSIASDAATSRALTARIAVTTPGGTAPSASVRPHGRAKIAGLAMVDRL
jgi:hypothetical protein